MSNFTKYWYMTLAVLLLVGCAGIFLGSRDTTYQGNKEVDASVLYSNNWWASTLLLRQSDGKQWCSAVAINNTFFDLVDTGKKRMHENGTMVPLMELVPITYVVTAKHCSGDMRGGTASEVLYYPNKTVMKEIKHKVLEIVEHPSKDFALLKVEGHTSFFTPVYVDFLPTVRQDFIIGFRGQRWGEEGDYALGKHISPSWAYKGQSGGGVFASNYGLHAIVSTHVDGVNIYQALKDMYLDHIIIRGTNGK